MRGQRQQLASKTVFILAIATLSGCGSGVYEQKFETRLNELTKGAKWVDFWGPARVPGTPVTVRVPKAFTSSYLKNSPHISDGDVIHPGRFQPPFLQLPGTKMTFEGIFTENNRKLPFYCYLAVAPAAAPDVDRPGEFLKQLKATFPGQTIAWEKVDVETPAGAQESWLQVKCSGNQPFDVDPGNGTIETNSILGHFELWMHEANGYTVMIGWRVNDSAEKALKLLAMTPTAAGTVEFSTETDAAAPENAAEPAADAVKAE